MRAARDVERQAIRKVEGNSRSKSLAKHGKTFKKPSVGLDICVSDGESRYPRTRICQRQSARQAKPHCPLINGRDPQGASFFFDDDERPVIGLCGIGTMILPPQTIRREKREPQSKIPARR
jgi:hypothetical protein